VEPLLTAANVLYVFAYFVRNTLWLRALSLAGTSCLIAYFLTLPEPLMHAVYWNLVYVIMNVVWIGRLLLRPGLPGRAGTRGRLATFGLRR